MLQCNLLNLEIVVRKTCSVRGDDLNEFNHLCQGVTPHIGTLERSRDIPGTEGSHIGVVAAEILLIEGCARVACIVGTIDLEHLVVGHQTTILLGVLVVGVFDGGLLKGDALFAYLGAEAIAAPGNAAVTMRLLIRSP